MSIRQRVIFRCDHCDEEIEQPLTSLGVTKYPKGWVEIREAGGDDYIVCPKHNVVVGEPK